MIEVTDVVKKYITGDINFTALKKISLKIEKGEFTSIMGPSKFVQIYLHEYFRLP